MDEIKFVDSNCACTCISKSIINATTNKVHIIAIFILHLGMCFIKGEHLDEYKNVLCVHVFMYAYIFNKLL